MKQILFVDDEPEFLALLPELLQQKSNGNWKVFTALTHARALEFLKKEHMDLIVLDIGMPVMDGMQFLRLLARAHPAQQIVMLSGDVTEERRKACLEQGAALLLEKPVTGDDYQAVFTTLDSLSTTHSQPGFRGMMRKVGLQEVLRMECLARKSSVVDVFTPYVRGLIFIAEGEIIHAEADTLQGEAALYGLFGFVDAEFNMREYVRPARRTITTHWEFLLTEAAGMQAEHNRLEERTEAVQENGAFERSLPLPTGDTEIRTARAPAPASTSDQPQVRISELVLCSGTGEMLFESHCQSLDARLQLLTQVEQHAAQITGLLPAGCFDRVEMTLPDGRAVVQVVPDRRLLVRSAHPRVEGAL